MSKKTKILALTGIRSEYDLLFPLLKGIHSSSDLELGVIVSGAHLSPLHNYSIELIRKDGFPIVECIENLLYSDSLLGKAKSSAILMSALAQTLAREAPDFLMVLGDREESIIGAMTATYMNIPVIHLAGGDNTYPEGGNVDEQVRHAATKLSHVHLTMMDEHSQRVKRLGEEPWRVFTVGSAGVDRIREEEELSIEQLSESMGFDMSKEYLVVIHHPLSSSIDQAAFEMRLCLEQCIETGLQIFVGAPNSDPGSQEIIKVLHEYSSSTQVNLYNNLNRTTFVNLLRNAKCLVGNSSLAIHEAPYLCLPAINVGERQKGRVAGKNVQWVSTNPLELREALLKALNDEKYRVEIQKDRFIYGDGYMVERSLEIIRSLPAKRELLAKKITY